MVTRAIVAGSILISFDYLVQEYCLCSLGWFSNIPYVGHRGYDPLTPVCRTGMIPISPIAHTPTICSATGLEPVWLLTTGF